MNTHPRAPDLTAAELTDEGQPRRRRWTMAEVEQAVAAGILHEDEHIELIDGVLVTMSPKGRQHEIVREKLAFWWTKKCPDDLMLVSEPGLRLASESTLEPDIVLFPANLVSPDVTGETVLLVVEVSDSSDSYDLKIKGPLYARLSVREYWVIDPRSLKTTIHLDPSPDGYRDVHEYGPDETVTPIAAPMLAIRLADLITR